MLCTLDPTLSCGRASPRSQPIAAAGSSQAVAITASVGLNGDNRPIDVMAIQKALNRIPPNRGGARAFLDVDGLCGPKTRAAITDFQNAKFGWTDVRVDPGGPTLAALNAEQSQIPQDQVLQWVLADVPTARGALYLARRRLESIAPYVTSNGLVQPTGQGSDRDRVNLALVDECFHLRDFLDPTGSYNQLRYMFENMHQELNRCWPELGDDNGLFARNQLVEQEERAVAYVVPSGKFSPTETVPWGDDDTLIARRIYLTRMMRLATERRAYIDVIAHELAHLVSPPGYHVGDRLTAHSPRNEDRFRDETYNRILNAENYGWFTWRSDEAPFKY